jgi:hypothetical protein
MYLRCPQPSCRENLPPEGIKDVRVPPLGAPRITSDHEDLIFHRTGPQQCPPGCITNTRPSRGNEKDLNPLLRKSTNKLGESQIITNDNPCPDPCPSCRKSEAPKSSSRIKEDGVSRRTEEMDFVVSVNLFTRLVGEGRVCSPPRPVLKEYASRDTGQWQGPGQPAETSQKFVARRVTTPPGPQSRVAAVHELRKHQRIQPPRPAHSLRLAQPGGIKRKTNPYPPHCSLRGKIDSPGRRAGA